MPAMRRLMTTICHAAILTMLLPTVAGAAVYRVNTDGSGDFESIGEALAAAISSDVIELSDGTFSGTANRNLEFSGKAITLRSASGNPQACVIDVGASPGDPARAFSFRAGESIQTVVRGIGIRGGDVSGGGQDENGGAIICVSASPRFINCIIEGNTAVKGGALFCWSASPSFEGCVILGNSASSGGGIACEYGSLPSLSDCLVSENTAERGGALFSLDSRPALDASIVAGNIATLRGGAIYAGSSALVTLDACTFAYNEGPIGGVFDGIMNARADFNQCLVIYTVAGGTLSLSYGSVANMSCCNLFGNTGGDWISEIADQLGQDGNLSANPELCGIPGSGNYYLQSDSPCADGQSACGTIGARGVGCETTAAISESWSALKRLFSR